MAFQPEVDQVLQIGEMAYRIAEHPVAPGMPYGQEGRAAVVYQLVAAADYRALKVFKPRFRLPTLVTLADRLARLGSLPGLDVCRRTVLTARRHTLLLQEYPDLIYAVLMPWIEGPTWMEVLLDERQFTPEQSLHFAHSLADILSNMQEEGVAHCDLSGPNLILPGLAGDKQIKHTRPLFPLQLVDVEQLFGPDLDRPKVLPTGSQGYAHRSAVNGLWEPNADRFAGAVLLAEMLGWCDERVRAANWGENYFDPEEMQHSCERYDIMVTVLRERWGTALAELFERAWNSETLDDCPTFGEWFVSLPDNLLAPQTPVHVPSLQQAVPAAQAPAETPEDTVKELVEQAQKYTEQGYLGSALALYREALSLAPERSRAWFDALSNAEDIETRIASGEEAQVAPASEADLNFSPTFGAITNLRRTGPLSAEEQLSTRPIEPEPTTAHLQAAPNLVEAETSPLPPVGQLIESDTASRVQQAQQPAHPYEGRQNLGQVPVRAESGYSASGQAQVQAQAVPVAIPGQPAREKRVSGPPWVAIGGGIGALIVVVLVAFALFGSGLFGAAGANSPTATATTAASAQSAASQTTAPAPTSTQPAAQVEASPTAVTGSTGSAPTEAPTAITQATAAPADTPQPTAGAVSGSGTAAGQAVTVYGIAFSPDSKLVALGATTNAADLISAVDTANVRTITGHTGWVTGVAFSPDGKTLATSSTDQTARLWKVADGSQVQILKGHTDWVLGVAFSHDGKLLATGSRDATVRIWNAADGSFVSVLKGPAQDVTSVAFSPDGRFLAAGSRDKAVWLWSAPDLQFIGTLEGAGGAITSIAFSPDSTTLAAGSVDKNVYTWAMTSKKLTATLTGHTGAVNSVAFSPTGTIIASGSDDKSVRIWSLAGSSKPTVVDAQGAVTSVAFSPDGKLIAFAPQGAEVQLAGIK